MPKTMYPGRKIDQCNGYYETSLSFEAISTNQKILNMEKPPEQGTLYDDKIENMIDEYMSHKSYFKFKNKIIVAELNTIWYLVDGQHRIEMCKRLFQRDRTIDDKLVFCWYMCKDEETITHLFNSVNQDSTKNQMYVKQTDIAQVKCNEFVRLLCANKAFFAKKSQKTQKKKTIEEFRDDIINIGFMDNFNTGREVYDNLMIKNIEFCKAYDQGIEYNIDSFYECDKECVQERFIFPLKNTNFIKWLCYDEIRPSHQLKKSKKRITRKLKLSVWVKEFSDSECCVCPLVNCSRMLIKHQPDTWHAGHITSENNNGPTELDNLRPICPQCNNDMGDENWYDYEIVKT